MKMKILPRKLYENDTFENILALVLFQLFLQDLYLALQNIFLSDTDNRDT